MTDETQSQKRLRVLITSPSLDESDNVSGISTIVRQIIRHCDCDFVHFAAGKKDNERRGLSWLTKQTVLPFGFLWTILRQNVDVVHINTAFAPRAIVRDWILTLAARFARRPVLLHPNGGRYLLKDTPGTALKWITGRMLCSADHVLVLSENERTNLQAKWEHFDASILPNAIDTSEIDFRSTPNEQKNIIFFGRIEDDKGLLEILEACRILKSEGLEFSFTCCGTGSKANAFSTDMRAVLGDRFEFRGVVSGADKWDVLKQADVFLLPSYFEGLPLAMLEAMAAKCVVVATDVGSISAAVEDGVNGLLVEPHNTLQLAEKLRFLLSGEANWLALGDNARKTIEENYSIHNYVVELMKIYRSLV